MPLLIDDLSIEKLSGPVIVVLAIPKPKYKNTVPVFLLFGEQHAEVTQSCDGIDVKEQFEEILEKLHEIAQEKEVHFFAEHFFDNKHIETIQQAYETAQNLEILPFSSGLESEEEIKPKSVDFDTLSPVDFLYNQRNSSGSPSGLLKLLLDTNSYCYFNELKKKYPEDFFTKLCPYPNIIWQFADIRYSPEKNVDVFQNIAKFDFVITDLIEYLLRCSIQGEIDMKSNDKSGRTFFTNLWNTKCSNAYDKFKTQLDKLQLRDDGKILKNLTNIEVIESLQCLIDFYQGKFNKITNKIINIHRIQKQITKLTKRITGKPIQIGRYRTTMNNRSMNKNKRVNMNIKNQISNYLSTMSNIWNLYLKENIELFIPLLKLIMEFLKEGKPESKFQEIMEYVNNNYEKIKDYVNEKIDKKFQMFIQPFSSILDIYFLLRSFKYNKARLVSALIGYNHILHIIIFFKSNKNMYDLYCFDNNDNSYRTTLEYYQGNPSQSLFENQCVNMNQAYNEEDELIDFDKNIIDYI